MTKNKQTEEHVFPSAMSVLDECFDVLNDAKDTQYFDENWRDLAGRLSEAVHGGEGYIDLDCTGKEATKASLKELLDRVREALVQYLKHGNYELPYLARDHFEAISKDGHDTHYIAYWTTHPKTGMRIPGVEPWRFGLDSLLWTTTVKAMQETEGLWHDKMGVCKFCNKLFMKDRPDIYFHTDSCRTKFTKAKKASS